MFKRFLFILLMLLACVTLRAEYDQDIVYLLITSDDPSYNYKRIERGYLQMGQSHVNYDEFTIEDWKRILCRWGCEGSTRVPLYNNLISYTPIAADSSKFWGSTFYQLKDTFMIDVAPVVKVEVLNVVNEFLLTALHSNLKPEDSIWFNKPFLRHIDFYPVVPSCNTCDDELAQEYHIMVHEESKRIDWVVERLHSMEEMHDQRLKDIENYYGWLDKSSTEYQALLHSYGPAFLEFLKLLEHEKVVIVYDSGW